MTRKTTKPKTWTGWMVFGVGDSIVAGSPLMYAAGTTRKSAISAYWWVIEGTTEAKPLPPHRSVRRVRITLAANKEQQ